MSTGEMRVIFPDQSYSYLPITTPTSDGKTVVTGVVIDTSRDLMLYQETTKDYPLEASFPVPHDASLSIHGDAIMIKGRIEARNVHIVCRRLLTAKSASGEQAAIIVTGQPGDAPDPKLPKPAPAPQGYHGWSGKQPVPGTTDTPGGPGGNGMKGQDGAPGKPGGTIEIICEEIDKDAMLTLIANGGAGGAGQDGQDGGDGGRGGDGKDYVAGVFYENATDGGKGGDGSAGGNGGQGGPDGSGGYIRVTAPKGPLDQIRMSTDPGAGGQPGARGEGDEAGEPGTGGADKPEDVAVRAPMGGVAYVPGVARRKGNGGKGSRGAPGRRGADAPTDPAHGDPASAAEHIIVQRDRYYLEIRRNVEPLYLRMMFHKARMAYLAAGEDIDNSKMTNRARIAGLAPSGVGYCEGSIRH